MDNNEIEGIAIIGMSGRFPGAENVDEFWQMVLQGKSAVTELTDEQLQRSGIAADVYQRDNYVKKNYIVADADKFDAGFFGYTPREAETTDPQHRLLIEACYTALEDAGCNPATYNGRIGTFLGVGKPIYTFRNVLSEKGLIDSIGALEFYIRNEKPFAVSKISYKLGLTGPSMAIDTACSTSLVAIHQGCQSLYAWESDIVLAGGVSLNLPLYEGYEFHDGSILSRDGLCRPFDQHSSGTTNGGGVAVVALKRAQDAIEAGDNIIAIIKGSAINNDGKRKISYTAPSYEGQVDMVKDALLISGIAPEEVTYIEAHGTGTRLGDPLEIDALAEAYQLSETAHPGLTVGSVKSNVGHMDIAAGAAGLIKTAKALQDKQLPPTANFTALNPKINHRNGKIRVTDRAQNWQQHSDVTRKAGVSSLGIGGTNCHVILEEAPPLASDPGAHSQLIVLSAKTEKALNRQKKNLAAWLDNTPLKLADVAHTLAQGRMEYDHRCALVCQQDTISELLVSKKAKHYHTRKAPQQVVFMFPGQGSQYVQMGQSLYANNPLFAKEFDTCVDYIQSKHGIDLKAIMWAGREDGRINQTQYTQPCIFVMSWCQAKLLLALGIQADVMLGHSIGEYVAACIAGVMSLQTALDVVIKRAQLMASLPEGDMMIVPLPVQEVTKHLSLLGLQQTSIAVDNGPELCVIAGPSEEVQQVKASLVGTVECHPLHTSHAFHSPMMEPILDEFKQFLAKIEFNEPQIPYISNLTGEVIDTRQPPEYWAAHLRNQVQFRQGVQTLLSTENSLFIEVGAGTVLSSLVNQQIFGASSSLSCGKHVKEKQCEYDAFLQAIGEIWGNKITPDWQALLQNQRRLKVSLPGYPFDRTRHWLSLENEYLEELSEEELALSDRDTIQIIPPADWIEEAILDQWQSLLGIKEISTDADFFELGGHSLLASRVVARLREETGAELSVIDMFENPSISALAKKIADSMIEDTDSEELEGLLDEMENLGAEALLELE